MSVLAENFLTAMKTLLQDICHALRKLVVLTTTMFDYFILCLLIEIRLHNQQLSATKMHVYSIKSHIPYIRTVPQSSLLLKVEHKTSSALKPEILQTPKRIRSNLLFVEPAEKLLKLTIRWSNRDVIIYAHDDYKTRLSNVHRLLIINHILKAFHIVVSKLQWRCFASDMKYNTWISGANRLGKLASTIGWFTGDPSNQLLLSRIKLLPPLECGPKPSNV